MAKIIGWIVLVGFLASLAFFAAGSLEKGLIVLGFTVGATALCIHLVGMIVHNDWWPWRHL